MKFFLLQVLLVFLVKQTKGQSGECSHGDVILSDGNSYTEGRVEVCFNGRWGIVCDDQWSYQDAQVVCKQLGYPYSGAMALSGAYYGPGNGLIHMDDVECTGDEEHLFNCEFIQNRECEYDEDASVICTVSECTEEAVHLVGGMSETEGQIEICHGGNLYRVCGKSYSSYKGVQVVCKELGYPYSGARPIFSTYSGAGNGLKYIHDLLCTGNEEHLLNCTYTLDYRCLDGFGSVNCTVAECTEGAVRLVGGMNKTEGRVEICFYGSWGNVCDNLWTVREAKLVCKQLGFPYTEAKASSGRNMNTSGWREEIIQITTVECTGNENSLINCQKQEGYCGYTSFVKVQCHGHGDECTNNDVRIVGGPNAKEGQVEVCLSGVWGTVCGNKWNEIGARVVCRHLGHEWSGAKSYTQAYHGQGSEPALLIYLGCNGDEESIFNCTLDQDPSSCTDDEVAGIVCTQKIFSTPASFSAVIGVSIALIVLVLVISTIILVSSVSYKRSKIKRLQRSNIVPVSDITICELEISARTARNQYVTDIDLQNFERKASDMLQSCIIRKSNLRVLDKIGQGEFGIVYRGVLEEQNAEETKVHAVAIKTLKGYFNESHIDKIFEEATKMKSFDHKNVLSLNGVCLDLMETPCIIMPFMSRGSLLSYLRKESTNLLIPEFADEDLICDTTKQLLTMCLQVAKGMTYLTQKKFVHRDLAARNCMISSMGIIKVADFGLSESLYNKDYFKQTSDSNSHVKLPIKWIALESIHYGKFSEKTDVWSFGVLCWEIFSLGKTPYPGLDSKAIVKMLDTGERMSKPLNAACTDESYSLMMSCWNENADERPHFSDIEQTLEQAIAPLAGYMEFTDVFNTENESID